MTAPGCPICRNAGVRSSTVGVLAIRTCLACGHGWLEDLPSSNWHFETGHYAEWRAENRVAFRRRAEAIVAPLLAHLGRPPRSALEIGCATGEVLGALAERGTRCAGVDASAASIETARREFPTVTFSVGTDPDLDSAVEVVLMLHVLEHIAQPVEVLDRLRGRTESGGLLYLRLPNYSGWAARCLGPTWPDFFIDHLHYFTVRSIRRALEDSGWKVCELSTAGQAWPWLGGLKRLLTGQRPARGTEVSSPPSSRRMRILDRAQRWARPWLAIEERYGRGNELVVLAVAER